ncbi:MAG TPA: hypothetical protein VIL65_01155 [Beijerinckiaceae bacterium]|jgi:hypothetical protein
MRRLILIGLAALALAGATIPAAKAGGFEGGPFGPSRYERETSDITIRRVEQRVDPELRFGDDRSWEHRRRGFERPGVERDGFERHRFERRGYERHGFERHAWGPGHGYGPRCIVKIDRVWTGYGWEVDRRKICR